MALSKHSIGLIKNLKNKGLIIKNKEKFISFLFNYGVIRVIDGYSFFLKKDNQYVEGLKSKDLINFVLLDRKIANLMGDCIMLFEQQLNAVVVQNFLKINNLTSKYVIDMCADPFLKFDSPRHYEILSENIYTYANSSNLLSQFNISVQQIPLINLALSWTLNTTIGFYRAVDANVQISVLEHFELNHITPLEFIDILHIVKHFRNSISHNDMVITNSFNDNASAFAKVLRLKSVKKVVGFLDVVDFLTAFTNDKFHVLNGNLRDKIMQAIKKAKFKGAVLHHINNLLGIEG
ncbi:Abi family protein [Ureaplasma urealyticum]|uniref:Abi family protein n=1 Tax=Ureaplasma urealyticum TaxID=2130 RepID=A0ABD4SJZ9_UREUR|nr:Abi family protein [Ureaplasma urealyticum]MCF1349066.1 Abi family protein [Ureaplasma urealyticum]